MRTRRKNEARLSSRSWTSDLCRRLPALFERVTYTPRFKTLRQELRAVGDGTKGVSSFEFDPSNIDRCPLYREVSVLASRFNLLVTHRFSGRMVQVYVHLQSESWRVAALSLFYTYLRDSVGPWTDETERIESLLLGYSAGDIRKHAAQVHQQTVSTRGATLHMILSKEGCDSLSALGYRAVTDAVLTPSLVMLVPREFRTRPRAATSVDKWGRIVRMAVAPQLIDRLLEVGPVSSRRGFRFVEVQSSSAQLINEGLRSRIEVLTEGGWR